jgi:hypothetical protein
MTTQGARRRHSSPFPARATFSFSTRARIFHGSRTFFYRDAICTDAVWRTRPLDIVMHYTTAFLRETLNADPEARAALAGQQPRLDNVAYDTTIRP